MAKCRGREERSSWPTAGYRNIKKAWVVTEGMAGIRMKYFVNTSKYCEPSIW